MKELRGHSMGMQAVRRTVEQAAGTDATILIRGESGVGKEIVAKIIHGASPRRDRPLIKMNCAALPAELLESELFGYERGAFTGAYRSRPGKFETACGGTIVLDEIGELPLPLQTKLLRVLQDHEVARVGGSTVITVEIRIIAVTTGDLEAAVCAGRFRRDLYDRLKVVPIEVPPLRERCDEIPVLAATFLDEFNRHFNRNVVLSPATLDLLTGYSWPGNVRELENAIKRAVILEDEGGVRQEIAMARRQPPPAPAVSTAGVDPLPAAAPPSSLREIARRAALQAQREAILDILQRVQWNRAEAARVLGISYKGLLNKLDQCGIPRKRPPRMGVPLSRKLLHVLAQVSLALLS